MKIHDLAYWEVPVLLPLHEEVCSFCCALTHRKDEEQCEEGQTFVQAVQYSHHLSINVVFCWKRRTASLMQICQDGSHLIC